METRNRMVESLLRNGSMPSIALSCSRALSSRHAQPLAELHIEWRVEPPSSDRRSDVKRERCARGARQVGESPNEPD